MLEIPALEEKLNEIISKEQLKQKIGQQPIDHFREQGVPDLHDGGHNNYLETTTTPVWGIVQKDDSFRTDV